MLNEQQAIYYSQQLHPAFAGFVHDGTISTRDALASIFLMLESGVLEPVWKDNSMLKPIIGLRKTGASPKFEFEEKIIQKLFNSKNSISTKEAAKHIKNGAVAEILSNYQKAIASFPIVNQEIEFTWGDAKVEFTFNGEKVDTIHEATKFQKVLKRLIMPLYVTLGILFVLIFIALLINPNNPNFQVEGDIDVFLTAGIIFIATGIFSYFSFIKSTKTGRYNFENDVIPIAKQKYDELYEFIKQHPLSKHQFTNMFLPYAISFGLDNSWHKDFGLEKEIQVEPNVYSV